jgi:(p)ppGpp synthase/HD superfamily hydrolase
MQRELEEASMEMDVVKTAELVAEMAHRGQVDKSGVPYIEHPRMVASYVTTPEEKAVGFLHDTLEDTYLTEEDLRPVFGDVITDAVVAMTHLIYEDYFTYIERVSKNSIARKVKLADLTHNMDSSRLIMVTQHDRDRLEKYKRAYAYLSELEK